MEVAVEGLRFSRQGRLVLEIPELRFASGERTAILGPNGSGKTTLLRLIGGLERPETGGVRLGESTARGRPVAFGFQQAVFLRGTVRSNMQLALELAGIPGREHHDRVERAAEVCGVTHLLDRKTTRLSGGEARRASVARTLSLRAPVTLLDEPLAGLDPEAREQLLVELPQMLDALAATVLVVTHDREEAVRLANNVVVLMEGRVRASGRVVDVLSRPPDGETAVFLGFTPLSCGHRTVAVAPGALSLGRGETCFEMRVRARADYGWKCELSGEVSGVAVTVSAPPGTPEQPGDIVTVSAPAAAVIPYP